MKKPILLIAAMLCCGAAHGAEAVALDKAVKAAGHVIFLRHAHAPGFGDPPDFAVEDCSKQRNLDAAGRDQARAIGAAFRRAGLVRARVLSSPWCRCLDTARLLDIGPVEVFAGLGSFFQGLVGRDETLEKLERYLDQVPPEAAPPVLVTHYVVISTVTGITAPAGGAVLYDPATKRAWVARIDAE